MNVLTVRLVFLLELRMHPQEFLPFVHHADEAAEARVFGLEQGVKFAQGRALCTDSFAVLQRGFISCSHEFADFCSHDDGRGNDIILTMLN